MHIALVTNMNIRPRHKPPQLPDRMLVVMYALLLIGLTLLVLNHISVLLGHPWLIPHFLQIQ